MNKSDHHKDHVAAILTPLYSSAEHGFKGRDALFDEIKEYHPEISRRDVAYFLSNVESHQLHLVRDRNRTSRPIIASRPHERWEIDLVDMSKLAPSNRQIKWLLNIIDVYSKYAWSKPLPNKRPETVRRVIAPLLREHAPSLVQSDNGPEFAGITDNPAIKQIFIRPYTPQSNGQIERFNATLKRKIYELMTSRGTRQYIDKLNELIENYNNTRHSVTKHRPSDLVDGTATWDMRRVRQGAQSYPVLQAGDKCRVAMERLDPEWRKNIFKKKHYLPRWSVRLYTIQTPSRESPHWYTLREIPGRFEGKDLMKVDEARLIRPVRPPPLPPAPIVREPVLPLAHGRVPRPINLPRRGDLIRYI